MFYVFLGVNFLPLCSLRLKDLEQNLLVEVLGRDSFLVYCADWQSSLGKVNLEAGHERAKWSVGLCEAVMSKSVLTGKKMTGTIKENNGTRGVEHSAAYEAGAGLSKRVQTAPEGVKGF